MNTKKLTTLAGIALCATGLAFATDNQAVNAATVNPEYTVQAGDTLWDIANKEHVDLDQLEALNGKDANHTLIVVGEKLKLPTADDVKSQTVYNNATASASVANAPQNTQTTQTAQASQTQTAPTTQAPQVRQTASPQTAVSGSNNSAKEWIAQRESGGSYSARNGIYIGRYQLSSAYLNGDYSPANQERVAQKYVNERYGGSWAQAKAFWQAHGWY